MTYGLIIAAGNQSRFKSETPKSLVDINGETLLQKNIRNMAPFCDKIYVVCSYNNEHFFTCENKIVIESGKGSGDAVWQALEKLEIQQGDSCFILWGDCFQSKRIYETVKSEDDRVSALIPCVFEEKPYVQIIPQGKDKVSVHFSKFNESITSGFHDLSLFYCQAYELLNCLRMLRSKITDKYGNYIHKHGNEMEFLDVFNETPIRANCVEIEDYKDFSFNTVQQLAELIERDEFSENQ